MATAPSAKRTSSTAPAKASKDWRIAASIGLLAVGLGWGAWAWMPSSDASNYSQSGRLLPAWVDLGQMTPQMSDGRMLRVHVNLMVKTQAEQATLTPMIPAFQNMVTQLGSERETSDMADPDAMANMAEDIQTLINNQLAKQREGIRVSQVAFSDWVLLPE